jgi:hypothetical protein
MHTRSGSTFHAAARAMALCCVLLLLFLSCTEPLQPTPPPRPHEQQDTTSHDIEWTVYMFGPGIPSSSILDIIAFSDTDVWAVGSVYGETRDSTGRRPHYNLLRWDGKRWSKHAVRAGDCKGGSSDWKLSSIAGVQGDVVLMTAAGGYARSDGARYWHGCFTADSAADWGVPSNAIHYRSSKEMYFSGATRSGMGELSMYRDGRVRKIATVPWAPIKSLQGDHRGYLWAGGHQYTDDKGSFLCFLPNTEVMDLRKTEKIDGLWDFSGVSSLWISKDTLYANVPGYLYIQALYDTSHYRYLRISEADPTRGYKTCMTGRANNDVFVAGHRFSVVHYNGKTMRAYPELAALFGGYGIFLGMSMTAEYVYICGFREDTRAVIAVGRRIR